MVKAIKGAAKKTKAKTVASKKGVATKVKCQDAAKGPISIDTIAKKAKVVVAKTDDVDEHEQASAMQWTFKSPRQKSRHPNIVPKYTK